MIRRIKRLLKSMVFACLHPITSQCSIYLTSGLTIIRMAETILGRWKALLADVEAIYTCISEIYRPSIFELVLHPVKASYIFVALQITLGRNQLYACQRCNSANTLAQEALKLFDSDFSLREEYHELLNRKWNHSMRQPHYGFGDTWHAPSRDMISGLCYVQRRQNSNPIVGDGHRRRGSRGRAAWTV